MATHRSAMGKTIDMTAMFNKNERVRAVGNMKVNARGDTIDADGKIIVPVTEKVSGSYAKTVGNKSAQAPVQLSGPPASKVPPPDPAVVRSEVSLFERELADSLEDDLEAEAIKAASTPPQVPQ